MSQPGDAPTNLPSDNWVHDIVEQLASVASPSPASTSVSLVELRRLREHLAHHMLRLPRLTRATEGIAGHRHPLTNAIIPTGTLIPVQIAKYVKHVLDGGEWDPESTNLEAYLADIAAVVQDARSDVYLENDDGHWKLTFGRELPALTQEQDDAYTVVSFLPAKALWLTGFRPDRGRRYVAERGAGHQGRWIKA